MRHSSACCQALGLLAHRIGTRWASVSIVAAGSSLLRTAIRPTSRASRLR
jgi:hypothetical protein